MPPCVARRVPCAGAGQLLTKAHGDVSDKVGRPADNGQLGFVDAGCRLIGLHQYDGMLKVRAAADTARWRRPAARVGQFV